MKKQLLSVIAASVMILSSCHDDNKVTPFTYPDMAEAQNPAVLFTTADGVKVYNG
ncbi:MAG: esterase-like of phytase family protein, partial [Mucilaginibacter sp.]|nr:esterase-like of phytase family protein [Mucilaginibacter sp.]